MIAPLGNSLALAWRLLWGAHASCVLGERTRPRRQKAVGMMQGGLTECWWCPFGGWLFAEDQSASRGFFKVRAGETPAPARRMRALPGVQTRCARGVVASRGKEARVAPFNAEMPLRGGGETRGYGCPDQRAVPPTADASPSPPPYPMTSTAMIDGNSSCACSFFLFFSSSSGS